MIDLHIHTTHSDGDFTPVEILKKAQEENLDIIYITDHNVISAYDELEDICIENYFDGKIIVGSELKCVYNHMPMEVLAYGFDRLKIKRANCITNDQKIYEIQSNYLEHIKKKGKQIGLFFDSNLQIEKGKKHFAASTFEKELWKDNRNEEILKKIGINIKMPFYREAQSNPNSIFYIDETKDYPEMQEVLDEIHKAGGLAFLAHLYEYPLENHEETIKQIIEKYDFDGIECYHSNFTKAQSENIIDFCKKHNLYMSGGSDYHGKSKPKVKFARAVEYEYIQNQIIKDWITKIKYYN